MKNTSRMAALLCTAAFACGGVASSVASAQTVTPDSSRSGTVPGWPGYVAMGAVGGPNIYPPTATSTGGDDDFGGHPIDVVFKYAGNAGTGDPGILDAPTNALRMQGDLTAISGINNHATRVAMVEYTGQMSGGVAVDDFTNTSTPDDSQQGATFLMARHFISLSGDAIAMNSKPIVYDGKKYFGTLIMNPDLLGTVEQNNTTAAVANTLASNPVNTAVDQALCFVTTSRHYTNESNPNGLTSPPYLGKTYHGGPVGILEQMLADGYPVWSINSAGDVYWNTAINNLIGGSGTKYSQVGKWFNACVANPTYDQVKYQRPNFANNLEGWVQANNWLIRTFSPKGHVTFGWQDNMWAIGSGFWLHADMTNPQIASTYSTPVSNWLNANAPSAIKTGALGASYAPDYFVFDRYETDDSSSPGAAALYNARAWDNYVTGIGQISANFNNIPIMMWQIPGSHIPYKGEANPELFQPNPPGGYVFSTAPDYFFGDSNLSRDLKNIISGPASSTSTTTAVGSFEMNCGEYSCSAGSNYKDFLLNYKGQPDNYDWGRPNGKMAMAAANHVFAILWGGGSTTNVIKNFSNQDDHGWLSNKVTTYYQRPTKLPAAAPAVDADHPQ